ALGARRHLVEESTHRVDGGIEPRRFDVGRGHRARNVDEKDDCGVLLRYGQRRGRPRQRRRRAGQREYEERERGPSPPRPALLDQLGEDLQIGERNRIARASSVDCERKRDQRWHDREGQEHPRRREAHRERNLTSTRSPEWDRRSRAGAFFGAGGPEVAVAATSARTTDITSETDPSGRSG